MRTSKKRRLSSASASDCKSARVGAETAELAAATPADMEGRGGQGRRRYDSGRAAPASSDRRAKGQGQSEVLHGEECDAQDMPAAYSTPREKARGHGGMEGDAIGEERVGEDQAPVVEARACKACVGAGGSKEGSKGGGKSMSKGKTRAKSAEASAAPLFSPLPKGRGRASAAARAPTAAALQEEEREPAPPVAGSLAPSPQAMLQLARRLAAGEPCSPALPAAALAPPQQRPVAEPPNDVQGGRGGGGRGQGARAGQSGGGRKETRAAEVEAYYSKAWQEGGTLKHAAHLDAVGRLALEAKIESIVGKTLKLDARGAQQGRALVAGLRGCSAFAEEEEEDERGDMQSSVGRVSAGQALQRQMAAREHLSALQCLVCLHQFTPEQVLTEGFKGFKVCCAHVRAATCFQQRPARGPLCTACTVKCAVCKARVCKECVDACDEGEVICKACAVVF